LKRKYRLHIGLIVLLISGLIYPVSVQAANSPSFDSVLIVYDSLGIGTKEEGNVEALKRLLAAFRVEVTTESIDSYTAGSLSNYSKLIEVHNRSDLVREGSQYLTDLQSYQGDILYIGGKPQDKLVHSLGLQAKAMEKVADFSIGGFVEKSLRLSSVFDTNEPGVQRYGVLKSQDTSYPYGIRKGPYAYVPFMEKDMLSEIAVTYVLKDWLLQGQENHYYLVFKEIYPFSDLQLLERMSDELYEAGIPFIVSVHPVFNNTDYPAMKRYINTLKYVQSRNGTVLVEAPFVATAQDRGYNSLYSQMEHFIDVLAEEGVVPLGMGAEMFWTYDDHLVKEGMTFFNSVILFPDMHPIYKARRNRSEAFSSSIYSVNPAFLQRYIADDRLIKPLPMDTAFTYDFVQNESELESLVQGLKNSWITFEDYKKEAHNIKTETNELKSDRGSLVVNGVHLGIQTSHVETSSDYEYKKHEQKSFETWFTVQNKFFIIVIFITLFVFSGFLIIGYRMYKRKYYK
jgi:uncharacterized protein YdaL